MSPRMDRRAVVAGIAGAAALTVPAAEAAAADPLAALAEQWRAASASAYASSIACYRIYERLDGAGLRDTYSRVRIGTAEKIGGGTEAVHAYSEKEIRQHADRLGAARVEELVAELRARYAGRKAAEAALGLPALEATNNAAWAVVGEIEQRILEIPATDLHGVALKLAVALSNDAVKSLPFADLDWGEKFAVSAARDALRLTGRDDLAKARRAWDAFLADD